MSERKLRKRGRNARGGFTLDNWFDGYNTQERLKARMRLRGLQAHYNEVGERVGASEASAVVAWSGDKGTLDASQLSEEIQDDLRDLMHTKAAIRTLAAELGINWLGTDTDPQEVMRVIGEQLEGSRRTGGPRPHG